MKAMTVVAHPDDCVIFAYSYMHAHPQYTWTVCYLTYTLDHPRGKEVWNFWNKRNIAVKFLGFKDLWNQAQNCPGHIDAELAAKAVQFAIFDQDLILTHGADGEYGHPHHVLLHQCVKNHPNKIYFAGPGQGNCKYSIEPGVYNLDELPLHRNVIAEFHKIEHTNEYTQ